MSGKPSASDFTLSFPKVERMPFVAPSREIRLIELTKGPIVKPGFTPGWSNSNSPRPKYHFGRNSQYPISASTSRRLRSSARNVPIIRDVVIITPGVCTPRAVMQAWLASITTATPLGARCAQMASAT